MKAGQYSKLIVWMVGTITAGLQTYYPANEPRWAQLVVYILTGIGIYLIPNSSPPSGPGGSGTGNPPQFR